MQVYPYLNKPKLVPWKRIVRLNEFTIWNADDGIAFRKVCMDMGIMVRRPILTVHANLQSGKLSQCRHELFRLLPLSKMSLQFLPFSTSLSF